MGEGRGGLELERGRDWEGGGVLNDNQKRWSGGACAAILVGERCNVPAVCGQCAMRTQLVPAMCGQCVCNEDTACTAAAAPSMCQPLVDEPEFIVGASSVFSGRGPGVGVGVIRRRPRESWLVPSFGAHVWGLEGPSF